MKAASFVCALILFLASGLYCQSSFSAAPSQFGTKARPNTASPSPMNSLGKSASDRIGSAQGSQGALSFANPVTYDTAGYGAEAVAAVDVNGDGKPDLVIANGCGSNSSCNTGSVTVLLNNGNGTFAPAVSYSSSGFVASAVAVSDVNGDGKPDIVVVNNCSSGSPLAGCTTDANVAVLLGNGDGTFQTTTTYDTDGYVGQSVAIADVNGDGKPDLIVVNRCGSSSTCETSGQSPIDSTAAVLLGNGDGTFQTAVTYDTGSPDSEMVAAGDVNNDGNPDLVVANNCYLVASICDPNGYQLGSVSILIGNSTGSFTVTENYLSGVSLTAAVALADLANNGNLDIALSGGGASFGGEVGIFSGNGNGTFQDQTTYSLNSYLVGDITIADVNGDGNLDLEVSFVCDIATVPGCTAGPAGAAVFLGNGDGTFQGAQYFGSIGYSNGPSPALAVADFNGDGRPDLVVSANCADNGCSTNDVAEHSIVGVLINTTVFPNSSPSTTVLTASPNPSYVGQSVTFTATVIPSGSSSTPAGTVSLSTGTTSLGVFSLTGGVAKAQVATLPAGAQTVTATYNGSAVFTASSSASLSQVVSAPDFSITSASSTATIAAGGTATYTVDLSGLGGFTGSVALTCGGAPSGTTCSLSPDSVAINGSTPTAVKVTVTTAGGSARSVVPASRRGGVLALWLSLAGLPGFLLVVVYGGGSRGRHWRAFRPLALVGLLCAVTLLMPACGGSSGNKNGGGTPAGTYTLSVTGSFTSGSTSLSHTAKLTLVVQ